MKNEEKDKRKTEGIGLPEALLSFPAEEHVKKVCKPGQEKKTCRYLLVSSTGWQCGKADGSREVIDERVEKDEMTAQGDNCQGILGIIMDRQSELVGKKGLYKEVAPSHEDEGSFKEINMENGIVHIISDWGDHPCCDMRCNIKYLKISVNSQGITFGLVGVGILGGKTTVLFN